MFLDGDPLQIGVAAAALLSAFLLGYAARSYVSHRRRQRFYGVAPVFYPHERPTTATNSEAAEIPYRHNLWKALLTTLVWGAVIGWMWFQFPACEQGQVAVFAPQNVSMWACAQGHVSPLRLTPEKVAFAHASNYRGEARSKQNIPIARSLRTSTHATARTL